MKQQCPLQTSTKALGKGKWLQVGKMQLVRWLLCWKKAASALLGQAAEGSQFVLQHHSWHLTWEWRGNWGWSPVLLWDSAGNVTLGRAHFVSASCSSPVWAGLCKNGDGRIQEAADTLEMYRVSCSAAFCIVCAFQPCRSHQCLLSINGLCFCVFICGFGLMVCAKAARLGALSLLIALATLTSNLQ